MKKNPGTTPAFRTPDGKRLPGSVAEVSYRRIGGIDQWVLIRGESIDNPPLIMLHGGPGMSEMGFFRYFNAPLEKHFTVVNWDQRGAGKSFDPATPESSMTVERFIADLDELVDAVCERLDKKKVVLFGHSWGSALGVLYAARFPTKVAAYVGSGQIGDNAAGEAASYAFSTAEAELQENRTAVKALRAIGPPPHTPAQFWIQRSVLARLEGGMSPRAMLKNLRMVLGVPEASLFEIPRVFRALKWSCEVTWPEVSRLNLIKAVPALEMPVFFFLGRRDHWVPPETSVAYFDVLRAPSNRLEWFEASGHEPFVDEPGKFNAAMIDLVRPSLVETGLRGAAEADARAEAAAEAEGLAVSPPQAEAPAQAQAQPQAQAEAEAEAQAEAHAQAHAEALAQEAVRHRRHPNRVR